MRGVPIEALERLPLFADLTRHELQSIARLFKDRRFPKGETVVKEGWAARPSSSSSPARRRCSSGARNTRH